MSRALFAVPSRNHKFFKTIVVNSMKNNVESVNVRVNPLCSQNTDQNVPKFNRFKVLEDMNTIQASNKSDMGFHVDVHSKVTRCKTPVKTCANISSKNNVHLAIESKQFSDKNLVIDKRLKTQK